jgi:hypothetical protein
LSSRPISLLSGSAAAGIERPRRFVWWPDRHARVVA